MSINLLKRSEINDFEWDNLINKASNSRIYALSWYLDILCDDWQAIILNDYDAVMPLPVRSKFLMKYVYLPFFIQHLGVFFIERPSDSDLNKMFCLLKKKFHHFNFNINIVDDFDYNFLNFESKYSQVLHLNKDYKSLRDNYSKNVLKNLKRAKNNGLRCIERNCIDELIELQKEDAELKNNLVPTDFFEKVREVLFNSLNSLKTKSYVVVDEQNNEIGYGIFVFFNNRVIKFTERTSDGKKMGAGFLIHDTFIKEFADSDVVLDFVGSSVSNVEYFNKGFGASDTFYYRISQLKIFK